VTTVRRLAAPDRDATARMLARAFDDDPLARYIFPSDRVRPAGLRSFFGIQLRHMFLPAAESYVTEDLTSAALWVPPGRPPLGAAAALRLAPLVRHTRARTPRTLRLLAAVDSRHPRQPHFYLGVLGTDPPAQGRGLGSAVMQPVLERCDAEGTPAYLESSKERNVPFYRRHGFEVTEELRLPGAPPLWLMWREPRPE
jgi:GNAT superfamily N-acetyltransferase